MKQEKEQTDKNAKFEAAETVEKGKLATEQAAAETEQSSNMTKV